MQSTASCVPAAVAIGIAITVIFGEQMAIAMLLISVVLLAAIVLLNSRRQNVPLGGSARFADGPAGREMLARELGRSRRYGRPLVLLRASISGSSGDRNRLIAAVAGCVRATDHAWVEGDDLYVAMPEAATTDAQRLSARMREVASMSGADLTSTIGVFPDDALSGTALIELVLRDDLPNRTPSTRVVEQGVPMDRTGLS